MATKKQTFANLHNQRVTVTMVGDIPTIDDIPRLEKELPSVVVEHAKSRGINITEEDVQITDEGKYWSIEVAQYPQFNGYKNKPRLLRVRTGTLVVRSADYAFTWRDTDDKLHTSYGWLKDAVPHDDGKGFDLKPISVNRGVMRYRLVE